MALEDSDGASTESTTAFVIGGSVSAADVHGLCRRLRVCLEESCADVVVCDVGALHCADVVALNALARLQLTALRLGRRIRLHHASPELRALLAFAGLTDVLLVGPSRQAEEREQRVRVEERMEPDDPAV